MYFGCDRQGDGCILGVAGLAVCLDAAGSFNKAELRLRALWPLLTPAPCDPTLQGALHHRPLPSCSHSQPGASSHGGEKLLCRARERTGDLVV